MTEISGVLYGRESPGRLRRSTQAAGKMPRYEIRVVEIARLRATAKNLYVFPPVISSAATKMTVDTTPESTFTRSGVPNRAENLPEQRGPAPS